MSKTETDEQMDYIAMLSPAEQEAFSQMNRLIVNDDLASLAHLRECIAFYAPTDPTLRTSSTHYPPLITALHDCELLPPSEDYSRESELVRAQCKAFVTVLEGVINWGSGATLTWIPVTPRGASWKFNDARFVHLILNSPEKAERIVSIVKERQTQDYEVVSVILHSDAPAMSEGTL